MVVLGSDDLTNVVIRITVDDVKGDEESVDRNTHAPEDVKKGLTDFETYVTERGYEDFHFELTKNPRMTERGVLHAEGTFAGPSQNASGEHRDPKDFVEYNFMVLEDADHQELYLIELYYNTAKLASFEITSNGLKLLSGEFEQI